jgi:predicted nucleic-acid-binding protein
MQIIDTNIVLRYILDDHPELSEKARRIIDDHTVTVPIEVLCEVVYVLASVYKVSRPDISDELKGFFANTLCELSHRDSVLMGLDLYAKKTLDIVDCILAGYKEVENVTVHTFDKRLQKLMETP